MKLKTSKKYIREHSARVYSLGYCELQEILSDARAFAYSAGIYGWACDYYDAGCGIIISTGYSPIGDRVPADLVQKYKGRIETARQLHAMPENKKGWCDYMDELFADFCADLRTL